LKRPHLFIAILFVSILSANIVSAKQTLYKLGDTPFSTPPISTVQQLKDAVESEAAALKEGFDKAGEPALYQALVDQLPEAEISTIKFNKGESLDWMLYRKNGVVKVTRDVTWGAEEPFDAFQFSLDQNGKRHTIIVPWICVNFALKEVTDIPAPPPAAPVAAEDTPPPVTPVEEQSTLRLVADLGLLYQFDPATYLLARFGVERQVTDHFSLLGMVGAAPRIHGSDGEHAFVIDAMGVYRWDAFFIGLGVGGWLTNGENSEPDEKSKFDLIADVGYRIWGKPEERNLELFVEARSGIDEFDECDKWGRIGGGLRFRF